MDSFTNKSPAETVMVSVDFSAWLGSNDTIRTDGASAPVVTATVYKNADASPGNIISGPARVSGNLVYQLITAGVLGVTYRLDFKIVTTAGETLIYSALITIVPHVPA